MEKQPAKATGQQDTNAALAALAATGKALPNSAVLLNSWKKPATALRPSA